MNSRSSDSLDQSRSGFTLVELLVVIAIIGVLIALLLPAVQAAREAARRVSCNNNMKQVGLAMHNHVSAQKRLPSAALGFTGCGPGEACEWRGITALAQILPYMEEKSFHDLIDFKVRWINPKNAQIWTVQIPIYVCPSDQAQGRIWRFLGQNGYIKCARTNMAICINSQEGEFPSTWGTVAKNFQNTPPAQRGGLNINLETDAAFYLEQGRPLRDFLDGTSNTVLGSEMLAGRKDDGKLGTTDYRGLWYNAFVGGCAYMHKTTPNSGVPDRMRYECWSEPDMPCEATAPFSDVEYFAARSKHAGGVNVFFADGHVRFVTNTVDLFVWQAIATVKKGESVDLN